MAVLQEKLWALAPILCACADCRALRPCALALALSLISPRQSRNPPRTSTAESGKVRGINLPDNASVTAHPCRLRLPPCAWPCGLALGLHLIARANPEPRARLRWQPQDEPRHAAPYLPADRTKGAQDDTRTPRQDEPRQQKRRDGNPPRHAAKSRD